MKEFKYSALPEKTIYIDLPDTDGLKIKTILRGNWDQPLVILVHGRPGSGNDLLEYLCAKYLSEHGYSSLRLFLYDFEPNTRNLLDCTLQTHANDFDTAVNYIRQKGTQQIFAAGHSYGGITILKATAQLDGAVLQDSSHALIWQQVPTGTKKDFPEKLVGNINIGLAGYGYIEPKSMVDDDYSTGDNSDWAKKSYPIKVIAAGNGILAKYGRMYYKAANEPKSYIEIKNANHTFDDSDEVMFKLFEETAQWFNRFRK